MFFKLKVMFYFKNFFFLYELSKYLILLNLFLIESENTYFKFSMNRIYFLIAFSNISRERKHNCQLTMCNCLFYKVCTLDYWMITNLFRMGFNEFFGIFFFSFVKQSRPAIFFIIHVIVLLIALSLFHLHSFSDNKTQFHK